MKKSLIAASASAVALAAMPVMGAFADVTDTVEVTVSPSCTVKSGNAQDPTVGVTLTDTLANGATREWAAGTAGGSIEVACNYAAGWNVKAVGASTGTVKTSMTPLAATSDAIPTGTTGTDSYWAFQVTGDNTVASYNTYSEIPATATKVAGAEGAVAETINTGYKVHIAADQEADTYTGKVTYTVHVGVNS